MGVDLDVLFAGTLTAEEAFALPERLGHDVGVRAACYACLEADRKPRSEYEPWQWDTSYQAAIVSPASIRAVWDAASWRCVRLQGTPPGILYLNENRIEYHMFPKLGGFASDYEGCQTPIRLVCRAIARLLHTDRVLYLPDSGDWPTELFGLSGNPFAEAVARLTGWGPPAVELGALMYGTAVRTGYHYASGALRHPDGTALTEEELSPSRYRSWIGGFQYYADGRPVPPEDVRENLHGGFTYYIDDFHDLS